VEGWPKEGTWFEKEVREGAFTRAARELLLERK